MVSVFPKDHCPLGRLPPPPWFSKSDQKNLLLRLDFFLYTWGTRPVSTTQARINSKLWIINNVDLIHSFQHGHCQHCKYDNLGMVRHDFAFAMILLLPERSSKVALGAFSPVCTAPTRSSQFQILQEQRQPCFDQNLSSLVDSDTRSLLNRRL